MTSTATLPAWCPRLIDEFLAADALARAIARPLSLEQLNWQPHRRAWSVGQCLDHLRQANVVYCPPIARALEGRSRAPVEAITPGWFGRWFLRRYIDPATQGPRHRAPGKIVPRSRVEPDILDRFLASNRAARELVERARDLDGNRIRFRNPFVPLIHFTVGTGFEIMSKHQHRHLRQAQRARDALPDA